MNILVVCFYGKNRSRYLASYLEKKGYTVDFGGVIDETDNKITQEEVDWSNLVIFVQSSVKDLFDKQFKLNGQRIITLEVEDRPEIVIPEKMINSIEDWVSVQKSHVYPELERQINLHMPF